MAVAEPRQGLDLREPTGWRRTSNRMATALMVLSTDQQVPEEALVRLRASAGISDVHTVES